MFASVVRNRVTLIAAAAIAFAGALVALPSSQPALALRPSQTSIVSFVEGTYQVLLGRQPESHEAFEFWVSFIEEDCANRLDNYALFMLDQPEVAQRYDLSTTAGKVEVIYRAMLHRASDASGLAFHVANWNSYPTDAQGRAATIDIFNRSHEWVGGGGHVGIRPSVCGDVGDLSAVDCGFGDVVRESGTFMDGSIAANVPGSFNTRYTCRYEPAGSEFRILYNPTGISTRHVYFVSPFFPYLSSIDVLGVDVGTVPADVVRDLEDQLTVAYDRYRSTEFSLRDPARDSS
ncbi:MAG: hypothetical protein AB8G26_04865, partial [Ilumatobacter sp.]